ncbi:hypothetical protein C4K27_1340 [Pseudomonas chlororaphis subsp. chlororaphis]|nr:hypothetical protein C4K27_1340 [Pseudomonas chlororaphis subsp. chlororaphis]
MIVHFRFSATEVRLITSRTGEDAQACTANIGRLSNHRPIIAIHRDKCLPCDVPLFRRQ